MRVQHCLDAANGSQYSQALLPRAKLTRIDSRCSPVSALKAIILQLLTDMRCDTMFLAIVRSAPLRIVSSDTDLLFLLHARRSVDRISHCALLMRCRKSYDEIGQALLLQSKSHANATDADRGQPDETRTTRETSARTDPAPMMTTLGCVLPVGLIFVRTALGESREMGHAANDRRSGQAAWQSRRFNRTRHNRARRQAVWLP